MSLVILWLRLCTHNAGDLGSIPGQGTRSCMPQLKSPRATTKTRLNNNNKKIKNPRETSRHEKNVTIEWKLNRSLPLPFPPLPVLNNSVQKPWAGAHWPWGGRGGGRCRWRPQKVGVVWGGCCEKYTKHSAVPGTWYILSPCRYAGKWWRTGKPGVLRSMGSQRVRHKQLNHTVITKEMLRDGRAASSHILWFQLHLQPHPLCVDSFLALSVQDIWLLFYPGAFQCLGWEANGSPFGMPTCITSWGKPSASGGWEPIDKCFSLSVLKGIILRGIFALHRQFRWNRAPVPHSNAQLNLTPRSGFSSSPSCLFASVPSVPQKAFLFSASAFRAIRLSEAGESTPDKQISSQDEWQQGLCCWW